MDEVATVSVRTKAILKKTATHLGLVFAVGLMVLLQFLQAVRKLASPFIGTVALLHEFFAQLRFLFMGRCGEAFAWGFLCGEGVAVSFGWLEEGRDL